MYSPVAMRYPMQMAKTKQKQNKNNNGKNTGLVMARAPAAVGTARKRTPPKVNFTADGDCLVTHHEFVADVNLQTSALTIGYTVNPQDATTFTWLSALATRYETYQFVDLKFQYRPSCSTTTDGYVIIGMDFDAYDEAPSKSAMLAWRNSAKSAAWQPCDVSVKASLAGAGWRYNGVQSAGDNRVTNLGVLWVQTDQGATTKIIGEVYVSYTVRLKQPSLRIPPALYAYINRDEAVVAGWQLPIGNALIKSLTGVPTSNVFRLSTPGQYIMTLFGKATSSFSNVNITYSTPVDSPSSEYFSTLVNFLQDTTGEGSAQYLLNLIAGSVIVTLSLISGGTLQKASLTMGTFAFTDKISAF